MSKNRNLLLSMVQNREVGRSPIPLVYDLTIYGGEHIIITNYEKTEDELRKLAEEDRREMDEINRKHREMFPNLFAE